jgi:ADP-ribose pyrophosphatase YjhB (NUDIX family)
METGLETVLVWLLIEQNGAVLFALRKPGRPPYAGHLVLPGDEMLGDESATETLERVGREELDLRITGEEFVDTFFFKEDTKAYAVNVFRVGYAGQPRFRESGPFVDVRWGRRDEIADPSLPVPEPLRRLLLR